MNGKKLQIKYMSVLIFGGAGFVGRHYTEYFLKNFLQSLLMNLNFLLNLYGLNSFHFFGCTPPDKGAILSIIFSFL